jgi:small-conductance mechanosensitive channel
VLSWPQPFVLFLDFADSALVFELRAFLRDIEKQVRVGSDLRFAVERALREAEIELPYPQHDIHLRDIDRLEAAIAAMSRQVADAGGKIVACDRDGGEQQERTTSLQFRACAETASVTPAVPNSTVTEPPT